MQSMQVKAEWHWFRWESNFFLVWTSPQPLTSSSVYLEEFMQERQTNLALERHHFGSIWSGEGKLESCWLFASRRDLRFGQEFSKGVWWHKRTSSCANGRRELQVKERIVVWRTVKVRQRSSSCRLINWRVRRGKGMPSRGFESRTWNGTSVSITGK